MGAWATKEKAFDPETTHAMGVAFDGARWVLGLASTSSNAAESVARTIVDVAVAGERDPWRLRARVFDAFGAESASVLEHQASRWRDAVVKPRSDRYSVRLR